MGTYLQMGHQSRNLLQEPPLVFQGTILSPVNDNQEACAQIIFENKMDNFETIFDPQLYCPDTERQNLVDWSYFPEDEYI